MPYNDVPQAPQRFSATQPLIRENFNIIDASFQINHVDFADGDFGKHSKVDFTNQADHPVVTGTDFSVYNFLNATTTRQELYVKRQGAVGTDGIPFTARGGAANGWTYLPSGILMKWGRLSVGDPAVNLNAAPGPAFSAAQTPFFATATIINTATFPISAEIQAPAANPTLLIAGGVVGNPVQWMVLGI